MDDPDFRPPAMMVADFLYSAAVVLGAQGEIFFWELATPADIMLLGHWIAMRSVMDAFGTGAPTFRPAPRR